MSVSVQPLPLLQSFPCHARLPLCLYWTGLAGNGWMMLYKDQLTWRRDWAGWCQQSGTQTCPAGLWTRHLVSCTPFPRWKCSTSTPHSGEDHCFGWCPGTPWHSHGNRIRKGVWTEEIPKRYVLGRQWHQICRLKFIINFAALFRWQ